MCFQQTHDEGLRQLFLTMFWDHRPKHGTPVTVSLYLCSSGSNARGELRALEGRPNSSKSPSRVQDGGEGVAGRNGREKYFPDEGFLHKGIIKKIESVMRPEADDAPPAGISPSGPSKRFAKSLMLMSSPSSPIRSSPIPKSPRASS